MGRTIATLSGILVLALVAVGLTELTMAVGHGSALVDDTALRPKHVATKTTVKASATPSPQKTVATTPSPTPAVTATPTPVPTATTNSFVHMRAAKSTSSNILANLNGGTVLQLLPDSDSQWQQVQYNGVSGYVFRSYLTY